MTATTVNALIQFTNGMVGLQLRDQLPDIAFPGSISAFGGQVEEGETPYEGLAREIEEELGVKISDYPHEKGWSGTYINWRGLPTEIELYVVSGVPLDVIKCEEGFLCVVNPKKSLATLNIVGSVRPPIELGMRWINERSTQARTVQAKVEQEESFRSQLHGAV